MKKILSLALAFLLISTIVFTVNASELGDVDGDGKIAAADARLALRASVGLEKLSDEAFAAADTDNNGSITAIDARAILRTSVGLQSLHEHSYKNWKITKNATCTENGAKQGVCECGDTSTVSTRKLLHAYEDDKCIHCKATTTADGELPRLYFSGNISGMQSKSDVREIAVEYTSSTISFTGAAKLKVQGTSSLRYDKKNYTINFYEDSDLDEKMKVDVGWGAQNKYCLKANWIDRSHSRNIVSANIFTEIQQKYGLFNDSPANNAIDGFPIEIYINGEFLGIYTFNIPKDAWMFNMDESNPDHIVFCSEGKGNAASFNGAANYESWSIEVGEENEENLKKLDRLLSFIRNSSDEEFVRDFDKYMNLDAAINYMLLLEFMHLPDNNFKNMLLVTYDGEIWYPSLYDLDTSWGTYWDGTTTYNYENHPISFKSNKLFVRIAELFPEKVQERYFELREEILTKEHILDKFEAFINSIPSSSIQKEADRWTTDIPGFGIEQIEEYLDYTIPYLDEKYSVELPDAGDVIPE